MSGRLQTWLASERVLAPADLDAAVARQAIYGGSLDTAILERGVMTEAAVWARLSAATGFPAPEPNLCDPARVMFPPAIDAGSTRALRAVPVAVSDGVVEILCAEPVAEGAIRAAARAQGLSARLHVVPEMRLWAMRQRTYGEPMPVRYVPLLARAVGSIRARSGYVSGAKHAEAGARRAPSPTPNEPARPSASAGAAASRDGGERRTSVAGAASTPSPSSVPTPLEQVMDLSGGFAIAFTGAEAVDGTEARGAQPAVVISEADGGPVGLDVLSGVPVAVPAHDEPMPGDWGIDSAADFATEALCRRARDPEDKGRLLALRALRRRLTHPATQTLVAELRRALVGGTAAEQPNEAATIDAIESLAELRDTVAVRALIRLLDGAAASTKVAVAARQALVTVTAQDCGTSARRWEAWSDGHGQGDRVEWLLDGLAHKRADIRLAALEELRLLAGKSFGYSVNGPKSERVAARRRFVSWWRNGAGGEGRTAVDPAFLQSDEPAPLPPGPKAR